MNLYMKILIIIVFLSFVSAGDVLADCTPAFDTSGPLADIATAFSTTFPFSTIAFTYDFFDSLSQISPTSPAALEVHFFVLTFYPFSWVGADWVSVVASMVRVGFLMLVIVGIFKKLIEVVL